MKSSNTTSQKLFGSLFAALLGLCLMGAAQGQVFTRKPLPETINGQPIDSSLSANAVLNYVDHEVQARVRMGAGQLRHLAGGGSYMEETPLSLTPELKYAMVRIVAKFGVANLLEALRLGSRPRSEEGDTSTVVTRLAQYENSIIREALVSVATEKDRPALIELSKKDAQLASMIMGKADLGNVSSAAARFAAAVALPAPAPEAAANTNQPVVPAATTTMAPTAPPTPAPAAPRTAVVTTETKIETRTPNGGHATVPLSIGAKLIILSVNNDGTVTARADFGFKGTVPQSAIQMSESKEP